MYEPEVYAVTILYVKPLTVKNVKELPQAAEN